MVRVARSRGRQIAVSLVLLVSLGTYFVAQGNWKVYLWSDPATWGGHIPGAGEIATIPAGKKVLLDMDTPRLKALEVHGTLMFDDRDLNLSVDQANVEGLLQIGTENNPYTHHATITLGGNTDEEKAIHVHGGTVDIHGANKGPNWVRLSNTAPAGADTLELDKPVGWQTGDHIVLASTDFDMHQAEEMEIRSIRGSRVSLKEPLKYTHFGQVVNGVDERGEVGLLTHNIVFQGDETSDATQLGGELMIMHGGKAQIDGAEFRNMGKVGMLGHYPIHFHLVGEGEGSYVANSSMHHCYNRCITIHGTNDVHLVANVAYDTIGHMYFLEDGIETHNVLDRNLGILTKAAQPGKNLLVSDLNPGTFWITNPNNTLSANVAAGADGFGFWYAMPKHPTGYAKSPENDKLIWNRRIPLGLFRDNVTHSNEDTGLFVDPGPNPPGVVGPPTYDPHMNQVPPTNGAKESDPALARFVNFTGYKNRKRAIWLRGSFLQIKDARLADNSIGCTLAASDSDMVDSLVVGETANVGMPKDGEPVGVDGRSLPKPYAPKTPIVGFEFYDGVVSTKNVTFENFQPTALREASGIGYLRYTPFFIDYNNFVVAAHFVNAKPVFFQDLTSANEVNSGDGYRSAVFLDKDGSVTGTAGKYVSVKDALLRDQNSVLQPEWNAYICDGPFARLFVDNKSPVPTHITPVTITRKDVDNAVYRLFGVPQKSGIPTASFQTTVLPKHEFNLGLSGPMPEHLRLTERSSNAGDWVLLNLPAPKGEFEMYSDNELKNPLPLLGPDSDSGTTGYWVENGTLKIRLVNEPGKYSASAHIVHL